MKARHLWTSAAVLALSINTIFFNNCSGQKATNSNEPATTTESSSSSSNTFSGKLNASFQYVSTDGRAWGYAQDSVNRALLLKILFYANGPVGTGTYVGEAIARETSYGTYAGHYFSFQVPSSLMNGQAQQLYAYAVSAKPENLITPSPVRFASYVPKAEAFFNQNVQPYLTNCTSCHAWTYKSLYNGPLLTPLSINGGSPTNNRVLRKVGGLEGHSGGNFCQSGIDQGLCAAVQAWWRAEFQ